MTIPFASAKSLADPWPSPAERVAAIVSREQNIPARLMFHHSRCRAGTARARQLAMYLTHVVLGQSLSAIGQAFGRDRTTVSYACALIEDLRDDPGFDREVTRLETLLTEMEENAHVQ